MSWAELFHKLWQADWSSQQIADYYDVGEERVRILIGSRIVEDCDEAGIAVSA
jgi:hypothetical protein